MEIQPIFSHSKKLAPLPALPKKSCAFCGSVFITDSECESCGRQFQKETLGTPGGDKSFYALKERYRKDVGWFLSRFDSFLAKDAGLRVRYLALLKKRYLTLLDHFQRPGRTAIGSHAYLLEFRDLVAEMRRMGISSEYMYDMVELGEGTPLIHKLMLTLNEEFSGMSGFGTIFRLRIAGGPRVGFLIFTLIGYGGIIAAALWFFSYLAIR